MNLQLDSEIEHAEVLQKIECRDSRGIFFRLNREFAIIAGNFGDP